jgi:anaerobic ribonucleoside-triphosphate reductase activating protein
MRYGKINKVDIANGPGVRVSVFVSGCRNRCKGCFNPETWSFKYGKEFTRQTIDKILEALKPGYITGLSILGGDPFEPENIGGVVALCMLAKEMYPDKSIWVYTGYKYEDLQYLSVMHYIDVLVDGPFIESEKDLRLAFRGSRNQRIIDVQASRSSGSVTLKLL